MDETKKLAQFATGMKYEDLPKDVVEAAKAVILDQLGCELAGSTLPWGKATYKFVRDNRGQREETAIVNYGLRVLAQDAAFANASFGRSVEVDDVDPKAGSHLGSTIIASAMAVGEKEMVGGREIIRAVVLGYEVASRIARATHLPKDRGLYATTIFGPFGAATAAGLILGLDEAGLQNAIAIAATHASGIQEYTLTGGLVNRVHGGIAAYGGIRAALLAQRDFTGPPTALEGRKGFFRAFSEKAVPEEIGQGQTKDFAVAGLNLRTYTCCGRQNSGLDAVSKMITDHAIKAKDVEAITVHSPANLVEHLGHIKEPKDITNAQFCGRFGIALRLVKGGSGFKQYFDDKNLKDREIASLMKRIDYQVDESLSKIPGNSNPARVTIRLKDGSIFEETMHTSRGTPENPLSIEERLNKFRELASLVLPGLRVEKVIKTVAELDKLNSIYELSQLLVAE